MIEHDIAIPIGAEYSATYQVLDENNAAIPLTGFSGRGEVLGAPGDATPVLTLDVTVTVPATGMVNVRLLGGSSSGASAALKHWYGEVYSGPTVYRFAAGRARLLAKGAV